MVYPSLGSFRNTGGLCGMWDNDVNNELYTMDKDGINQFFTNVSETDLEVVKEFWSLNSKYNKNGDPSENGPTSKRCPECFLMSERAFYCPCDEFNMFDLSNYQINSSRIDFCKIPMSLCVER